MSACRIYCGIKKTYYKTVSEVQQLETDISTIAQQSRLFRRVKSTSGYLHSSRIFFARNKFSAYWLKKILEHSWFQCILNGFLGFPQNIPLLNQDSDQWEQKTMMFSHCIAWLRTTNQAPLPICSRSPTSSIATFSPSPPLDLMFTRESWTQHEQGNKRERGGARMCQKLKWRESQVSSWAWKSRELLLSRMFCPITFLREKHSSCRGSLGACLSETSRSDYPRFPPSFPHPPNPPEVRQQRVTNAAWITQRGNLSEYPAFFLFQGDN